MDNTHIGIADNWLRHVQEVGNQHAEWLATLADAERRQAALCELNVLEQARNVCRGTVVRRAWARGQGVMVHGWIYGLHDGMLQDIQLSVSSDTDIAPSYKLALAALKARHG